MQKGFDGKGGSLLTIDGQVGRRERKKRATKAALERAALELFLVRGFDQVTVADIAAEVDVDPSTFFRHFGSKEAVLYEDELRAPSVIESFLRERPSDESLRDTLRALFSSLIEGVSLNVERATMQFELLSQSDDLHAHHLLNNERIRERLAEGIADRVGTSRRRDARPDVMAAIVVAALDQMRADFVRKKRIPSRAKLIAELERLIAPVLPWCDELDGNAPAG